MIPRFKTMYGDSIATKLREELGLENVMQAPRMQKIVVNMGVGDATGDSKLVNAAVEDLRVITGQQPKVNRAKK